MSLACAYDYDGDYDVYVCPDSDLHALEKPRKCKSCRKKMQPGEMARRVNLHVNDEDGVKCGEWFLCEDCDEIIETLENLGYNAYGSDDSAQALLHDYQDYTGFDPKNYAREESNA